MDFFIWKMDPVLVSFGGLKIHWYGIIFATAIMAAFQFMKWTFQKEKKPLEQLDPLLLYAVTGIIVGARLGHCIFYDPQFYFSHPLKILAIWEGGLASHGGGIGVLFAIFLFCKKYKHNYLWLLDRLAVPTALAAGFIRIGNFFNSEIIGLPTTIPWAIIFENIDSLPRHAVQLYEAVAYFTIFVILALSYRFTKVKNYAGASLGLLLFLVFTMRFLLEFVKIPQASYASDGLMTTGQLLSIPFIVAGLAPIFFAWTKRYSQNS